MSHGTLYPVTTLEATHFIEALAQNVAGPMYNLAVPMPLWGKRVMLRAIRLITTENFGPEFNFFAKAAGITSDPQTDEFIAKFDLTGLGLQFGNAGVWRFDKADLAIPYHDADSSGVVGPSTLHVALCNRSVTAKAAYSAGPPIVGAIHATFWFEPQVDW